MRTPPWDYVLVSAAVACGAGRTSPEHPNVAEPAPGSHDGSRSSQQSQQLRIVPQGLVHVRFANIETAPLSEVDALEAARIRDRVESQYRETYSVPGHRRWFFYGFDTRSLLFFIARWQPDAVQGGTYIVERNVRVVRTAASERSLRVADVVRQYEIGTAGVRAGMSVEQVETLRGQPIRKRELGPVGSFDYVYSTECIRFVGFQVATVWEASRCSEP